MVCLGLRRLEHQTKKYIVLLIFFFFVTELTGSLCVKRYFSFFQSLIFIYKYISHKTFSSSKTVIVLMRSYPDKLFFCILMQVFSFLNFSQVFPKLREWCENRHLHFIECDLRWGVPKDSTTEATIRTCLGEIDRCSAETDGMPFFLNMLGER